MQTTAQAVTKIAEQGERLDELDGRLEGQDETLKTLKNQQNGQIERIDQLEKRTENEMDSLKKEIELLKQELAATKEKKSFFARLLGK